VQVLVDPLPRCLLYTVNDKYLIYQKVIKTWTKLPTFKTFYSYGTIKLCGGNS